MFWNSHSTKQPVYCIFVHHVAGGTTLCVLALILLGTESFREYRFNLEVERWQVFVKNAAPY